MTPQTIILAGDPHNGFRAYGPFEDFNEAFEWGSAAEKYPGHLSGARSWHILDVQAASMFAGKAILEQS